MRSSSYIYPITPIADAAAAPTAHLALILPSTSIQGVRIIVSALNTFFTQQLNQFKTAYPSLPSPTTHRAHCFAWSGYTMLPEVALNYGIRLDVSYYYYPEAGVANRPGLFTGSAMPMRLATSQGKVISIFEATTQITDESRQTYPFTTDTLQPGVGVRRLLRGLRCADAYRHKSLTPCLIPSFSQLRRAVCQSSQPNNSSPGLTEEIFLPSPRLISAITRKLFL
mgnify:CR=1 FL=1